MEQLKDACKSNFIEDQIICLTKPTLDLFFAEKNPADLIALYTFYYYTAKWQQTNQPYCTDSYVTTGLHWGYKKFRPTKKRLLELGLIEQIIHRNKKGKIEGFYIKVSYIFRQETINSPFNSKATNGEQSTNALSINNINALSINNIGEKNSPNFQKCEKNKTVKEIIYSKEFLNIIDKWNSTPRIANKHKNLQSKTVKEAYKYFKWLKNGTFLKNACIDEISLNQHNIPNEEKSFTYDDIIDGLDNVLLQYEDGYYPFELSDKKKILPKSLQQTFLSLYGCPSVFLKCFYNPPKCREDMIKEIPDNNPGITRDIKLSVFSNKSIWSIQENNLLISGIDLWWNRIKDVHEEFIKSNIENVKYKRIEMDGRLFSEFSNIQKFSANFILFINSVKEDWEKLNPDVRIFKSDYWWSKFVEWVKTDLELDLINCDMELLRDLYQKQKIKMGYVKVKEKSLKEQLADIRKGLKSTEKDSPAYEILKESEKEILEKMEGK